MRPSTRVTAKLAFALAAIGIPACSGVGVYWGKDQKYSVHTGEDEESELKITIVHQDELDDTDPRGSNGERLDATDPPRLYASLGRMMAGWSREKSSRFSSALAACINDARTKNEKYDTAVLKSLEGMTAPEIFARAREIKAECIRRAVRLPDGGGSSGR